MYLKRLQLVNYRNYKRFDMTFNNKVNVIIGENAQGKTNLLEAIYLLAFTKSYRTTRDDELIKWNEEFAKITTVLKKKEKNVPIEMVIFKGGKKAKVNKIEQKKLSDYIGAINIVMFAPEDLTLIKGPPHIRRRFIDMELGQIKPMYIYHLGQYQKILKQRNHLLKQMQRKDVTDPTLLTVLTDQLISHAVIVLKNRFKFIELLRKWAIPLHHKLSRQLETLKIVYNATIDVSEEDKEEKIKETYINKFQVIEKTEIERGMTLIGPHRDDLTFFINNKDVKTFGSQGQQRTAALSVKLAEIDLIFNETGQYPILLLDDVLSELDDYRQTHLLNTIEGKVQTFVTTTSIDGIDHDTIKKADIFSIMNGTVEGKKN